MISLEKKGDRDRGIASPAIRKHAIKVLVEWEHPKSSRETNPVPTLPRISFSFDN